MHSASSSHKRYTVVISIPRNLYARDSKIQPAASLLDAERLATNWLREARLTKPDGLRWNRWVVMAQPDAGGHFRTLAYGDHTGTLYTARDAYRDLPGQPDESPESAS